MKKVLYLSNLNKQLDYARRMEALCAERPLDDERARLVCRSFKNVVDFDASWRHDLREADTVILTHMGTGLDTPFLRQLATWLYKHHEHYILFVDEEDKDKLQKGFDDEQILMIEKYIRFSGLNNYEELINYLSALRGIAEVTWTEPKALPWHGIVTPEGELYPTYDAYMKEHGDANKPSVGIFFYREEWISRELSYQKCLYEELQVLGLQPILIFGQYGSNPRMGSTSMKEAFTEMFGDGPLPLELLINTGKFSFFSLGALTQDDLRQYDIPVLQGYNIYMNEKQWHESVQGLTAMDVSLSVALPEMDGAVHAGVVAGQTELDDGSFVYLPIAERVRAVAKRAAKWVALRNMENSKKKIAIVFHNYPASNSNIGSACGLDSPESVRRLLKTMQEAGYTIDHVPDTSAELMEMVLSHATNDRKFMSDRQVQDAEGKLTAAQYDEFFKTLSPKAQAHMTDGWGDAPGDVFLYDDELLVPGFSNGNIWITVQPPRGFGEDPSKIYHDPLCAPTHHYEGFYYWLRHVWQADAVVHVGTHGNLEWLPGKGTGLSDDCYPEMAIQDLPNVYPYWTTIVGEGIQAKRRGAACLIGHLTPPMAHSGLYDAYEELEQLLDEYEDFKAQENGQEQTVGELILEKAAACHLLEEIAGADEMSVDELTVQLHTYLTDLKHIQMRCGLHILGQAPQGEHLRDFLSGLVRVDNVESTALPQIMAGAWGQDINELSENSSEMLPDGLRKGQLVDLIWKAVDELLLYVHDHDYDGEFAAAHMQEDVRTQVDFVHLQKVLGKVTAETWQALADTIQTICSRYVTDLRRTDDEMTNTLRALAGAYIEGGPGGAPTGGRADVLPTGRNFYGVDQRLLPTKAAYEIGTMLADQVIESFIAEEGHYPEQVGMVLWAGSNTRSHGQCAAQFMNLLGVRPIWQAGSGRVCGLEVIPLEELKRPRIDVTGRISGLIRDMMPSVIKWLDKAVLLVAGLDESPEDNFVKKHIDEDVSWLMEEGEEEEAAYIKARWRIFGDPLGGYGAGIGKVLDSKNWETIDDLAEVYVKWGSYAYSTEKTLPHDDRLFRKRLSTMEVTIKNEDNREVSMLSSDDYNAYHGGMIAAVRSLSGKQPKSYVGDSSDKTHVKTRDLQTEIKRLFRAEAVNPKFIEGMMKHGYKGAADMASYLAHSYQWDATSAVMEDWMYDEYAQKYVFDEAVQDWLKDVNPWALQRMVETLLEAEQRGLWKTEATMKERLQVLYLSMEGQLEERSEVQ